MVNPMSARRLHRRPWPKGIARSLFTELTQHQPPSRASEFWGVPPSASRNGWCTPTTPNKQTTQFNPDCGGYDVCLFGRIGGAAGPVPQDDCSSPPTINDPERSSMATPSLSDPTTEDIGKASKSRAGWHRLALTPTAHEEEKWPLKLTLVYYANPQSSSLRDRRQCGK
jgi:hypothetical protein